MSTIRKNPPQPAPSRIAGTLKVRKPAPDAEPPVDPAAVNEPVGAKTGRRDEAERRAAPPRARAEAGGRRAAREDAGAPRGRRASGGDSGGVAPRRGEPGGRRDQPEDRRERPDFRRNAGDEGRPARARRDDGGRDEGGRDEGRRAEGRRDEGRRDEGRSRAPGSDGRGAGDYRQRNEGRARDDGSRPAAGRARATERPGERDRPARRDATSAGERATGERAARRPAAADDGRQRGLRREPAVADSRPPRPERRREEGPPAARPRPPQAVAKPDHGEAPEGVRLSKVMADRGICSRREADELIERGWVFVDGRRVSELGTRIDPDARVVLAPEAKHRQAQRVTILLHKPVGYVSGQPEPGYEPAVSLIGADNQFDRDSAQRFHPSQLKGLAPAGRLDIDSTGLLVLTQDGRIARQLIGDDSKVDKEYLVRVEGQLVDDGLALLRHGLSLDDKPLRPARVEWINDDQLRFVLNEGRKRQIRRMCELVGLKVVGLKRVRIGGVRLGDLPLGQWRYLREDEAF